MKEYRGYKVIQVDYYKKGDKNILGNYKDGIITLYKDFKKRGKLVQAQVLAHEWGHGQFYKLPKTYRVVWKLISNGKLIPLLNAFGLTACIKNAFIRDYAKKNYKEDFSVCVSILETNPNKVFHNFVDFKLKVVKSLLNKYQ